MAGMERVSAAEVATFLKGVDFPKSRDDIVELAEDRNAPDEVIRILEELPDRDYTSMADLEHEVGLRI